MAFLERLEGISPHSTAGWFFLAKHHDAPDVVVKDPGEAQHFQGFYSHVFGDEPEANHYEDISEERCDRKSLGRNHPLPSKLPVA